MSTSELNHRDSPYSNSCMWAPTRGFPSCPCIAATSMAQPVPTAAWLGTPTVPGTATPAPGSTPLGSGEYQTSTCKPKETSQGSADGDQSCGCFHLKRQCKTRPCGALHTTKSLSGKKRSYFMTSAFALFLFMENLCSRTHQCIRQRLTLFSC